MDMAFERDNRGSDTATQKERSERDVQRDVTRAKNAPKIKMTDLELSPQLAIIAKPHAARSY
jgi:hypothetical protein